jgi:hypothetical protein
MSLDYSVTCVPGPNRATIRELRRTMLPDRFRHQAIRRVPVAASVWMMLGAWVPLLCSSTALAAESAWFLFARDDGCVGLELAARRFHLPRTPTSPEDFAQMMQDRGHTVTLAPSPWFPKVSPGAAVDARFCPAKSLTFLSAEACPAPRPNMP